VLLELGPEPVRQKDIAKALGLDKSSVARLCKRMEQAGHVSQARDESDGRARAVTLTRAGTRLAREVDAASRARFERVLGALPRPQRRAVVDALGTLNTALEVLEQRELDR
jgi:MarR family transcriptional regulator for hemolysin